MRYAPKEEDDYGPSDALHVDEESASDVNLADVEDLEAPAPSPPSPSASDEKIKDDEIVILE